MGLKCTPGGFELRGARNIPGVIVGGVTRQYVNGPSRDQVAMVCSVTDDNGGSEAQLANAKLWANSDRLAYALAKLVDRDLRYFDGKVDGGQISMAEIHEAREALRAAGWESPAVSGDAL